MATVMTTRIVKIGNSQGIRIPKPLLAQFRLGQQVELEALQNQIVIRLARRVRAGWEVQFKEMAGHGDDRLLDGEMLPQTTWDEEEWEW